MHTPAGTAAGRPGVAAGASTWPQLSKAILSMAATTTREQTAGAARAGRGAPGGNIVSPSSGRSPCGERSVCTGSRVKCRGGVRTFIHVRAEGEHWVRASAARLRGAERAPPLLRPAPRGSDAGIAHLRTGTRDKASANSRLARCGDNDPVSPVLLKIFFFIFTKPIFFS